MGAVPYSHSTCMALPAIQILSAPISGSQAISEGPGRHTKRFSFFSLCKSSLIYQQLRYQSLSLSLTKRWASGGDGHRQTECSSHTSRILGDWSLYAIARSLQRRRLGNEKPTASQSGLLPQVTGIQPLGQETKGKGPTHGKGGKLPGRLGSGCGRFMAPNADAAEKEWTWVPGSGSKKG